MSRLTTTAEIAKIVESLVAIAALILGGIWFYEQRETYPHAQLEQSIQVVPVGHALIAVEVQARFQNLGKLLIHLTRARVKLQNVSGESYNYSDLAMVNDESYWRALRPVKSADLRQFNEGELRWPVLKQFDRPIDHSVEPGETDLLVFTFLMRCQGAAHDSYTNLHLVRVATDVLKPADAEENGFAWKARGFADVSAACSGKEDKK